MQSEVCEVWKERGGCNWFGVDGDDVSVKDSEPSSLSGTERREG